jgi:hypothetical protein
VLATDTVVNVTANARGFLPGAKSLCGLSCSTFKTGVIGKVYGEANDTSLVFVTVYQVGHWKE